MKIMNENNIDIMGILKINIMNKALHKLAWAEPRSGSSSTWKLCQVKLSWAFENQGLARLSWAFENCGLARTNQNKS